MPISQHTARTLAGYLDIVSKLIEEWSSPSSGEIRPWFRGQRCIHEHLVPGEYRYAAINPDEVRSEFVLKARELLHREPQGHWEWYFIMQHYGVPTRLLDWTSGSLIALHFALRNEDGSTDTSVWVLDPWALNKWSMGNSDLVMASDKELAGYLGPPYEPPKLPARPLALVPQHNTSRITVQRGNFTVHGSNSSGIDEQFKRRLARIVLPKSACIQLRRDLRCAGVSEFTLFPDLDGLARDISAEQIQGC